VLLILPVVGWLEAVWIWWWGGGRVRRYREGGSVKDMKIGKKGRGGEEGAR
jgi:hypothetical protein